MALGTRLRAKIKGEVSAADVEALLRGGGLLEDLRQRIEQKREAGEVSHPGRPWETHTEIGNALAFFWVAQGLASIGRALKEADDAADPGTQGYMPEVSHEQAMALLTQVHDFFALTSAALADPTYDGGKQLPVVLRARVEAEGRCPAQHLRGMLRGAQYLDQYAQVEVETYCTAVSKVEAPKEVAQAVRRLQAELAKAQSNLETAEMTVSLILNGERVDETTHEEAESYLWSSLETYIWLGQVVAIPALLDVHGGSGHRPPPAPKRGSRRVGRDDRWCLTSERAHTEIERTGRSNWAESELEELWENKRWKLSADENEFLSQTAELKQQGAIQSEVYLAECPFNPIWRAMRPVTVLGQAISQGEQFCYNHHHGKGKILTGFRPVNDFEECKDDD